MNAKKGEFCWFGAACLGTTALMLVLAAIDPVTGGNEWSLGRLTLVILAAVAFAMMGGLMSLGFRLEQER